jgi:arylsulfatase A-like enzyme
MIAARRQLLKSLKNNRECWIMTEKPTKNILLITADQWRGECLSALDHPCVKTPNIDKLIAESVLFKKHYSVCAPCGPSRASLLAGMYAQNHRSIRNGTPLDSRHTNIALETRSAGYDPVLFGYTDTSRDPRDTDEADIRKFGYEGVLPGFRDEMLLMESDPVPWIEYLESKGYDIPEDHKDLYAPVENYPGSEGKGRSYPPPFYAAEHSMTAFLTEKVIDYIGDRNDGWFAHVSYLRPHPPFIAPEPYNTMYSADDVPMPERKETLAEQKEHHPWLACALDETGDWYDPWQQQMLGAENYDRDILQVRATYYGLITKIDTYVGQLIDHLKATGAYDNTLIVLTSDHGELLGDHWLFGKRGFFDAGYYIPLIIRDPGGEADGTRGRVVDEFTESVDVMPSILDWLGLDIPRQCDGKSLKGFWTGRDPQTWRQQAHWEYDFRSITDDRVEKILGIDMDDCTLNVIRDEDYKYVHFTALDPLLFDVRADPQDRHNLADDPAYASVALKYAQKLLSWRMRNDERELTGTKVTKHGVYQRNG